MESTLQLIVPMHGNKYLVCETCKKSIDSYQLSKVPKNYPYTTEKDNRMDWFCKETCHETSVDKLKELMR